MIQRNIKWMNLWHSFTTFGSPTDLLDLIFVVSFTIGFEALTTVSMKSTILWEVMPCSHVEVYWHLRGMWSICLLSASCWCLDPWIWWYVPPRHQLTFIGLHHYIPEDRTLQAWCRSEGNCERANVGAWPLSARGLWEKTRKSNSVWPLKGLSIYQMKWKKSGNR
jgi:hypothetical protein